METVLESFNKTDPVEFEILRDAGCFNIHDKWDEHVANNMPKIFLIILKLFHRIVLPVKYTILQNCTKPVYLCSVMVIQFTFFFFFNCFF